MPSLPLIRSPSPNMKSTVLLSHLCALASPLLARAEYTVPSSVPPNDVFDGYVSYSIEFSSFPDYAGA